MGGWVKTLALVAVLMLAALRPSLADGPAMGLFVAWPQDAKGDGAGGREANLAAWEQRLGLPKSSLLAMDFYGSQTWSSLSEFAWLPAYWKARNPERKLIWSIPLTFAGTSLKQVALGDHDADFARAAKAIAEATPDAIVRFGWEMNGDWPWSSGGVERDYIAAYRHVVALFRSASPRFRFVWCVNFGLQRSPPDLAYPGDDVTDVIGMDLYDTPLGPGPEARWRDVDLKGAFGLDWLAAFAGRHRKPMALPEWGVGLLGGGDNPYFVERMAEWIGAHRRQIAFQAYFDVAPSDLDSGAFPKSRDAFLRLFAHGGPR